jgi:hypothetical protein
MGGGRTEPRNVGGVLIRIGLCASAVSVSAAMALRFCQGLTIQPPNVLLRVGSAKERQLA